MKVSLGNMCSFFCQFYFRLVNTVRFFEEKIYCISALILLLMCLGKVPKHRFLKVGGWGGGRGEGGGRGRGLSS